MATTRRSHTTQKAYFDQLQANDLRIQNLERGLNRDKCIVANSSSDERVRFKREAKAYALEQSQRQAAQNYADRLRRRNEYIQKMERTEALARSLRDLEDDKTRTAGLRLQIEEAPEIRKLRRQLEAARVSKGVKDQITNRQELTRMQATTQRLETIENQQLEEQYRLEEIENKKREMEEKSLYAKHLDGQLTEKEQARLDELALKREEAERIDKIIQMIEEEEEYAATAAHNKKAQLRAQEEQFIDQREEARLQRLRDELALERKAQTEAEHLDKRAAEYKAADQEKRAQMGLLQTQMAETIRDKQNNEEEIERLRQELYEEEYKELLLLEEAKQQEKIARRRAEMIHDHEQYLEYVARNKAKMEQEDREFHDAMMEKFARDDKLEQLSAQKRRMKSLVHGREIAAMMEERKARRLHEAQQKQLEHREMIAMEEARRDQIEAERRRILAEFAAADDMAGHLPKGVIREDDLSLLGPTMRTAYTRRPADEDF